MPHRPRLTHAFAALAISTTTALAHVGDHTGFSFGALTAHLFEADHIVFAIITVLVGILSYRAGRRTEARVHMKKDQQR